MRAQRIVVPVTAPLAGHIPLGPHATVSKFADCTIMLPAGCCPCCLQLLNGGNFDEFAILAMLLAGINTIPPLLFFVYMFTKGRILHAAVWVGQMLNGALFIGRLEGVITHFMVHILW